MSSRMKCRKYTLRKAILATAAGVSIVGTYGLAGPESADRPPNIVLIVADDLSRRLCSFLPEGEGNSLMPNLDRLAGEGVVLENLHSPAPVCTPSRFAILTGKFPSRSRSAAFLQTTRQDGQTVVGFNTHIIPGETTLPQLLKQAGYVTGAVGKNHVIAEDAYERLPYETQLDEPGVKDRLLKNVDVLRAAYHASGFDYAERLYFGNPDADGIKPLAMHNQEWITEGALSFIDENRDRSFFLYMAPTIPHGPFTPERSWRCDVSVTPEGILDDVPSVQAPRETIDARLQEAGIRGWNTGPVLWLDDAVGALVARLEALGIDDHTIIVFVSDHGTEAKGGAYQGGTLTAGLAWRRGGFPVGGHTPAALQLPDLAPTILDWAGADRRGRELDGKSFADILADSASKVHEALYFEMGYSRAVIQDGFKYLALRYPERAKNMSLEERTRILNESNRRLKQRGRPLPTTDPAAPFSHLFLIPGGHDVDQGAIKSIPGYFDADQLYDLRRDPAEQRNLASDPEYADVLARMKMVLDDKVRELPGTFGEFGRLADVARSP